MPAHKVPKIRLVGQGLNRTREDLDAEALSVARSAVSRYRVAFFHDQGGSRKKGGVREFLATPSGWLEVPPGTLMNVGLADGEASHEALRLAAQVLDDRSAPVFSMLSGPYRQVEIMPTQVPVDVTVRGLHRKFAAWMTQRRYRWAVAPFEPYHVRIVTRGGRPLDIQEIPLLWRPQVERLTVEDADIRWAPATAYGSHTGLSLYWVEATVVKEGGARLHDCLAGHQFVWIGRPTKAWCPEHHVEVANLIARYRRLSWRVSRAAPEERTGLQEQLAECGTALSRLGYRWAPGAPPRAQQVTAANERPKEASTPPQGLSAPKDLQHLAEAFGLRNRPAIPIGRQSTTT